MPLHMDPSSPDDDDDAGSCAQRNEDVRPSGSPIDALPPALVDECLSWVQPPDVVVSCLCINRRWRAAARRRVHAHDSAAAAAMWRAAAVEYNTHLHRCLGVGKYEGELAGDMFEAVALYRVLLPATTGACPYRLDTGAEAGAGIGMWARDADTAHLAARYVSSLRVAITNIMLAATRITPQVLRACAELEPLAPVASPVFRGADGFISHPNVSALEAFTRVAELLYAGPRKHGPGVRHRNVEMAHIVATQCLATMNMHFGGMINVFAAQVKQYVYEELSRPDPVALYRCARFPRAVFRVMRESVQCYMHNLETPAAERRGPPTPPIFGDSNLLRDAGARPLLVMLMSGTLRQAFAACDLPPLDEAAYYTAVLGRTEGSAVATAPPPSLAALRTKMWEAVFTTDFAAGDASFDACIAALDVIDEVADSYVWAVRALDFLEQHPAVPRVTSGSADAAALARLCEDLAWRVEAMRTYAADEVQGSNGEPLPPPPRRISVWAKREVANYKRDLCTEETEDKGMQPDFAAMERMYEASEKADNRNRKYRYVPATVTAAPPETASPPAAAASEASASALPPRQIDVCARFAAVFPRLACAGAALALVAAPTALARTPAAQLTWTPAAADGMPTCAPQLQPLVFVMDAPRAGVGLGTVAEDMLRALGRDPWCYPHSMDAARDEVQRRAFTEAVARSGIPTHLLPRDFPQHPSRTAVARAERRADDVRKHLQYQSEVESLSESSDHTHRFQQTFFAAAKWMAEAAAEGASGLGVYLLDSTLAGCTDALRAVGDGRRPLDVAAQHLRIALAVIAAFACKKLMKSALAPRIHTRLRELLRAVPAVVAATASGAGEAAVPEEMVSHLAADVVKVVVDTWLDERGRVTGFALKCPRCGIAANATPGAAGDEGDNPAAMGTIASHPLEKYRTTNFGQLCYPCCLRDGDLVGPRILSYDAGHVGVGDCMSVLHAVLTAHLHTLRRRAGAASPSVRALACDTLRRVLELGARDGTRDAATTAAAVALATHIYTITDALPQPHVPLAPGPSDSHEPPPCLPVRLASAAFTGDPSPGSFAALLRTAVDHTAAAPLDALAAYVLLFNKALAGMDSAQAPELGHNFKVPKVHLLDAEGEAGPWTGGIGDGWVESLHEALRGSGFIVGDEGASDEGSRRAAVVGALVDHLIRGGLQAVAGIVDRCWGPGGCACRYFNTLLQIFIHFIRWVYFIDVGTDDDDNDDVDDPLWLLMTDARAAVRDAFVDIMLNTVIARSCARTQAHLDARARDNEPVSRCFVCLRNALYDIYVHLPWCPSVRDDIYAPGISDVVRGVLPRITACTLADHSAEGRIASSLLPLLLNLTWPPHDEPPTRETLVATTALLVEWRARLEVWYRSAFADDFAQYVAPRRPPLTRVNNIGMRMLLCLPDGVKVHEAQGILDYKINAERYGAEFEVGLGASPEWEAVVAARQAVNDLVEKYERAEHALRFVNKLKPMEGDRDDYDVWDAELREELGVESEETEEEENEEEEEANEEGNDDA